MSKSSAPSPQLSKAELEEIEKKLEEIRTEFENDRAKHAKELFKYLSLKEHSLAAQCAIVDKASYPHFPLVAPETGEEFVCDGIPCATSYPDSMRRDWDNSYDQWSIPSEIGYVHGEAEHCQFACWMDFITRKYLPRYRDSFLKHDYKNAEYYEFFKKIRDMDCCTHQSLKYYKYYHEEKITPENLLSLLLRRIANTTGTWVIKEIINFLAEKGAIEIPRDPRDTIYSAINYSPVCRWLIDGLNKFLGGQSSEEKQFFDDFCEMWKSVERTEAEQEEYDKNTARRKEIIFDKIIRALEKLGVHKEILEDYLKETHPLLFEETYKNQRRLSNGPPKRWVLHEDRQGRRIEGSENFVDSTRDNDEILIHIAQPFHGVTGKIPHVIKVRCMVIDDKKYFEVFNSFPSKGRKTFTKKDLISYLKYEAENYTGCAEYAHLNLCAIPAIALETSGIIFNYVLEERHKSGFLQTFNEYVAERQKQSQAKKEEIKSPVEPAPVRLEEITQKEETKTETPLISAQVTEVQQPEEPREEVTPRPEIAESSASTTHTPPLVAPDHTETEKPEEARETVRPKPNFMQRMCYRIWYTILLLIPCISKGYKEKIHDKAEGYDTPREQNEEPRQVSQQNTDVTENIATTDMTVDSVNSSQSRQSMRC